MEKINDLVDKYIEEMKLHYKNMCSKYKEHTLEEGEKEKIEINRLECLEILEKLKIYLEKLSDNKDLLSTLNDIEKNYTKYIDDVIYNSSDDEEFMRKLELLRIKVREINK